MKKKFRENGGDLADATVRIAPFKGLVGSTECVRLELWADGIKYGYDIRTDRDHPELADIEAELSAQIKLARSEHGNIKITEDNARDRVAVEFQDSPIVIYRGTRFA